MMKKILIVDDNNHLSFFLEKKLTDAGHEIVTASNGLSAVKALADFTPDIIFCDYFLPNINGDELCRIIRRMGHLKDAYLVVMSAAASELNLDPSSIGADALIAKGSFQEMEKHIVSIIADEDAHRYDQQEQNIKGLDSVFPRQMTVELISKKSHLKTILDSISEGIVEVCCGQIVYVNAPAATILGKPQAQLLTIPLPSLFEGEARSQVESLLESDPAEISIMAWTGAKQPEDRILSMKKLPFQGDLETTIFLIADITERSHAEKKLRDSHHNLEELVQERTADLKRAHDMLQQVQKLEAIGTLAGGIAHDFNNILSGMIGYMELAQIETRPDKQKHYLDEALHVSKRAKDMINQILIFSRHQDQERKPILLAPIIKEGIKLLQSILPSTIQITRRIADQPAMILADATQIHQILMNLCTNASHAMRERRGVLDIQLGHEKVEPDEKPHPLSLAAGRYAKLTVSDSGHGIEQAIIDRIFDPFFTTKGPGEGTGLGLSVVYGIVRDHGGKIDVASEPGRGTTISIFLPLIETTKSTQNQVPDPMPMGDERILFVDDEAAIIEVAREILTSLGYRVTARRNSTEALELFRTQPDSFDLVITDMTMPNIRGDDLARELLKIRADIPIILCSGFSEMISEDKAKNIGIRQFMMKPLYRRDLAQVIRKVLD
jgi:signal transduction histidine kinase/DNA-binding response OmpR family regulator